MIKKKWFKRVGAWALAMSMILGCGTVNAAEENTWCPPGQSSVIDTTKKVTLTIHKYELESMDLAGVAGDGTTNVKVPEEAKPLEGVTFDVYKVDADTLETEVPDGVEPVADGTTDANGLLVFDKLAQGRYLVVETKAPDHVYEKGANFLVDLPTMNADGTSWNYNVHVYPKNAAVLGAVVLTKRDKDTCATLEGAQFKLQQLVGDAYVDRTDESGNVLIFTTDAKGQIAVNGLFKGEYQFVETKAPDAYGINTTPITFTIDKNATVAADGKMSKYVVKLTATDVKTPTIEKTADKSTASIGDTVNWTLTPTVPSDIATYQTYEVTDTLDSRLTYTRNSLRVTLNGFPIRDGYTVDFSSGIKVTFTNVQMLQGKKLAITFKTTIAKAAADTPGYIANKGNIAYENAYGTAGSLDSNEVNVYVGNIKVIKHEAGDESHVLKGAKFAIYKTEADAKNNRNQIGVTVTTDANGEVYFKGFAAGDYWIVEKESPTYTENGTKKHYLLLSSPEKVTVSVDDENATKVVRIANKKQGFSIPKTGGTGTVIFLFTGLMMISGAVIILVARKRREAN